MATTKPPIPVQCAKVTAVGTYGPAIWNNVFYFEGSGAPGVDLADWAGLFAHAVDQLYANVFVSELGTDWHLSTIKVIYRDASDSLYRATIADAKDGGVESDSEPAQVAYLINWATLDPRKGGKPRNYVVGVPDANMTDSVRLATTPLNALNTALATWLASLATLTHGAATGCSIVDMSFRDANAWRDTAVAFPILAGSLSPEVATQRRRVDRLRS